MCLTAGMDSLPTFSDVEAAAARIAPYAVRTPLVEHPELGERAGGRVFLKLEMFQRTGSFKFRGACNRILLIPEADRAKGVVAFSSGNHAQGVAAVAANLGIPATIVMPADAPRAKIEGTKALGATVVPYDRATGDREAIAHVIVARHRRHARAAVRRSRNRCGPGHRRPRNRARCSRLRHRARRGARAVQRRRAGDGDRACLIKG